MLTRSFYGDPIPIQNITEPIYTHGLFQVFPCWNELARKTKCLKTHETWWSNILPNLDGKTNCTKNMETVVNHEHQHSQPFKWIQWSWFNMFLFNSILFSIFLFPYPSPPHFELLPILPGGRSRATGAGYLAVGSCWFFWFWYWGFVK